MRNISKPKTTDYAAYAHIYIDLVPDDGNVLDHLDKNANLTAIFLRSLPEAKLTFRYAQNKWTIKEILGHLIDDERIYVYRALRFARNDVTELPGFDQDHFARYSSSNNRTLDDLLEEFTLVRKSTLAFFATLDDEALVRSGVGDGNRATVSALAYHIAGHELRHLNIIRERYLNS